MPLYFSHALVLTFTFFITSTFVFFISGAYLFFYKIDEVNARFKHPYLRERKFLDLPMSIRLTITFDYFLRILFHQSKGSFAQNANRLLSHVEPVNLPMGVRWPIVGLWGSCAVGLISMLGLWALLIIGSNG
ncbi:MAG: hypothetical protein NWQ00_00025 [Burkholderiaceae bacterium]|jgi:hypothetical protein|nr:hypothetical protein [Burkholderiaceae bacterium]MDP4968879.1 hypothetical protein [Burkholderiaceae bacterium]MDP5110808.1 hypothetical protein [Burkholderiaceae bacterium]